MGAANPERQTFPLMEHCFQTTLEENCVKTTNSALEQTNSSLSMSAICQDAAKYFWDKRGSFLKTQDVWGVGKLRRTQACF